MIEVPIFVWVAVTVWIINNAFIRMVAMAGTVEAMRRIKDGE